MNGFGDRIDEIIKKTGEKQASFARRVNIDPSYVSQLIKERRMPSKLLIKSICSEYNVNEDWLVYGKGEMYAESTAQTLDCVARRYSESQTFRAILDVYAAMDDDSRAALERFIERVADALEAGKNPASIVPIIGEANIADEVVKRNASAEPNSTADAK